MNRIAMTMLAVIALSVCSTQAAEPQASPPALSASDQKAVRALVDAFADSWNRHDMKAMHDIDTDDVEWINVVGHHWPGKDTVYRGHMAYHKFMAAKSVMRVESANIRSIAPDVAVAVATMYFGGTGPDGREIDPPTKTRGSFTAVKRASVWKFVHFHNTVIDPRYENDDLPSQVELPRDAKSGTN